jgi:hypothetical protein
LNPERAAVSISPSPLAPALARAFLRGTLSAASAATQDLDGLLIVVSDIATSLLSDGEEIQLEVESDGEQLVLIGNSPAVMPETARLLLDDRINDRDKQWIVRLTRV